MHTRNVFPATCRVVTPALLAALSVVAFVPTTAGVAVDGWAALPALAAQSMLTLAGVLMLHAGMQRSHGALLVLAGCSIGVRNLDNSLFAGLSWYWLEVGWVFGWCVVPLLAPVLLTYPRAGLRWASHRLLVALMWCWALPLRAVTALLWSPSDAGAATEEWLTLYPANAVVRMVMVGSLLMLVVLVGWFVLIEAGRLRSARGPARATVRVVAGAGILLGLAVVLRESAPYAVGADLLDRAWDQRLDRIQSTLAAAAPIALFVVALRAATRRSVVVERLLAAAGDARAVEEVLRAELGDATLLLRFEVDGSWVDINGLPADRTTEVNGRIRRTLSTEAGHPTVELDADASIELDPARLRLTLAAASVLLENTRLAVERTANLAEIRQSRGRIVEAGVRQRRQLERDLHDGAQQQLLAVAAILSRASLAEDGAIMRPVVDEARAQLSAALVELRNLARGIHPAALSQGGLGPGLAALAVPSGRVELRLDPGLSDGTRLPAAVETTAYFVVAEAVANALRHAGDCHISVEAMRESLGLRLTIADDGPGGATLGKDGGLAGLRDRVQGLGGSLQLDSRVDVGTRVCARLPLQERTT